MDYSIVEKQAFTVIGKELQVSTKDGENYKRIPQFWSECNEDGTCEKLCKVALNKNLLGICTDMLQEAEQFTYMVAVEMLAVEGLQDLGEDIKIREIPASTWGIFKSVGPIPSAIQNVWDRIFKEWFPATGYEHAGTAELEVYPPGDPTAEDYCCEVWIPVIKA